MNIPNELTYIPDLIEWIVFILGWSGICSILGIAIDKIAQYLGFWK
jgi:hypothetical protein